MNRDQQYTAKLVRDILEANPGEERGELFTLFSHVAPEDVQAFVEEVDYWLDVVRDLETDPERGMFRAEPDERYSPRAAEQLAGHYDALATEAIETFVKQHSEIPIRHLVGATLGIAAAAGICAVATLILAPHAAASAPSVPIAGVRKSPPPDPLTNHPSPTTYRGRPGKPCPTSSSPTPTSTAPSTTATPSPSPTTSTPTVTPTSSSASPSTSTTPAPSSSKPNWAPSTIPPPHLVGTPTARPASSHGIAPAESITATPAPKGDNTSTAPSTTSSVPPSLANTGAGDVGASLGVGAGALALGGGLLTAARRRPSRGH